jgi:hypothetical protein
MQGSPSKLSQLKLQFEPQTQNNLVTVTVTGLTVNPDTASALNINSFLSVCFDTNPSVPTKAYDAKLTWPADAPGELTDQSLLTDLKGRSAEASPVVFVNKEPAVGLRPIDKDLNIGASLISSVEDKEQPDKTILRRRTTRGTLDLRLGLFRDFTKLHVGATNPDPCGLITAFTPSTLTTAGSISFDQIPQAIAPGVKLDNVGVGLEQCLQFTQTDPATGGYLDPKMVPYHGPQATGGTYLIFTPLYLDAKVSTGSIVKDTLSINRVVFGSQAEFRLIPRIGGFTNQYRFILQGNHTSDRDFKQKEYTGTFKFQPLFGFLNHPLDENNVKVVPKVLCTGCEPNFKLVPVNHGFEFAPGIGVDLGRTYSRRRPAAAIEPSDTVRRVYFELNAVLNPTAKWRLSATEIFYIRGESKTDRYHNYFLGDVSYSFGTFANARASHSVFFAWERGGQPPFDQPDVNVLKFGYRVTAATIFSRGVR